MQSIADALGSVPLQTVQIIPDRMVAVFIGYDLDCIFYFLFAGQSVVFFQIQKQIFHIHIGQSGAGPFPSQRLHNIHPFGKNVVADCSTQQRVTLEHCQTVLDAVLHAAFLRPSSISRISSCVCAGSIASIVRITASCAAGGKF